MAAGHRHGVGSLCTATLDVQGELYGTIRTELLAATILSRRRKQARVMMTH